MKYLAAIQARFGSSRLPGKILMDLAGKPVLQRVIERVEKSDLLDEVIVITSAGIADIGTVKLVSGLNRRVFCGSENDVLDRYYQSTRLLEPEYVVRITGDCPLFDARLLDLAIEGMAEDTDYLANLTETLADGLDLEIMKFSALEKAWQNARLASEREHVTLYIKNHPEQFKLQNFECPLGNLNKERWSLDEPEDYALLKTVYEHFGNDGFSTEDVLLFLDENPELRELNFKYGRNEGLEKSLREDRILDINSIELDARD